MWVGVENRWNLHQIKRFAYTRACGRRVGKKSSPDRARNFSDMSGKTVGKVKEKSSSAVENERRFVQFLSASSAT